MPLSREIFEAIKLHILNLDQLKGEDGLYIKLESIIWVLEMYLECDVQTVQGDPNSSTGVNPKFSSGIIKDIEALNKVNALCLEAAEILIGLDPHPCSVAGAYLINLSHAIQCFERRVYKFNKPNDEALKKHLENEQRVINNE